MEQFSLLQKDRRETQVGKKTLSVVLIVFLIEIVAIVALVSMFFVINNGIDDLDSNLASIKNQQLSITDVDYPIFKLKNTMLKELQAEQIFWSEVLDIIEKNTSANVKFVSFSSEPLKNKILMKAQTSSFDYAANQLTMFREVPNFSDVEISQITFDEKKGTTSFDISLMYNKLKK